MSNSSKIITKGSIFLFKYKQYTFLRWTQNGRYVVADKAKEETIVGESWFTDRKLPIPTPK